MCTWPGVRRIVFIGLLLLLMAFACVACGTTSSTGDGAGDGSNPCRLNPNLSQCQQGSGNDHSDELEQQLEAEKRAHEQNERPKTKYG
jgi:hypothetical protein